MVKRFNERAGNTYKLELHEGGALAKLPEYFDAYRIGAVEMASSPWTMFAYHPALVTVSNLSSVCRL